MKIGTLLALVIGIGLATTFYGVLSNPNQEEIPAHVVSLFMKWKGKQNRLYSSPAESNHRLRIFYQKYQFIKEMQPQITYQLGLNKFSDLSLEEFQAKYTGDIPIDRSKLTEPPADIDAQLKKRGLTANGEPPKKADWREFNLVNEVQNQGSCQSCWAFSIIACYESAYSEVYGDLKKFSEQALVDCDTENKGCIGGYDGAAGNFLLQNGAVLDSDYPYKGREEPCKLKGLKKYNLNQAVGPYTSSQKNLLHFTNFGVVGGAVLAESEFMMYRSGVYIQKLTPSLTVTNHGINIIGWDLTADEPYFILKNQWGTGWGEKGYMRIGMKFNNGNGNANVYDRVMLLVVAKDE